MLYAINPFDQHGRKLGVKEVQLPSDVRAVVVALQMLRDNPTWSTAEVVAKQRLVRRIDRSDLPTS